MEGFFGKTKQQARRALGSGSTTHSLVHNLGDEFLLAYQQVTAGSLDLLAEPIDPQAYRQARDKLKEQEQQARQRRSFVRRLSFISTRDPHSLEGPHLASMLGHAAR